jgi:cytidylate kinase
MPSFLIARSEAAMIIPMLNLERQTDALARAQRHWQEAAEQPEAARRKAQPISIALTRQAGTNASQVAQEIGRRLQWPVYDRELMERIAREMGLHADLVKSLDEKHRSWLVESMESLTIAGPVSLHKFIKQLVETLFSLSALGHCVIVGRGAAHILPPESTLRVRLVGAKEDRIARVQEYKKLGPSQAERWVDETDRERSRFVMEHFDKDAADPNRYDLILNTSRWSVAECADFVIDALKKLEGRKA